MSTLVISWKALGSWDIAKYVLGSRDIARHVCMILSLNMNVVRMLISDVVRSQH